MLRLLLKVHWVALRLREEVIVQCSINHEDQSFLLPQKAVLKSGKAILNAYSEFFISCNDPTFEIQATIIYGDLKKFAGKCKINLQHWDQRSTNQTESILMNSPDSKAKIRFDFTYMHTDMLQSEKNFFNLNEYDTMRKSDNLKKIEAKNSDLSAKNSQLTYQMESLKKENKQLASMREKMNSEYQKNYVQYESEIKKKDEEIKNSQDNLTKMKQQMQKMQEIINNFNKQASIDEFSKISKSDESASESR